MIYIGIQFLRQEIQDFTKFKIVLAILRTSITKEWIYTYYLLVVITIDYTVG